MKIYITILIAMIGFAPDLFGQCFPDRHNTTWYDGWVSCEISDSPNPDREAGHWIMYDFEVLYALGAVHIWNSNDPAHLDRGLREVAIDYSVDGVDWIHAGDYTFEQGTGLNTYEGFGGPDLEGAEARFLLITAVTNWGGECYGLSEFNIEGEEVIMTATDEPEGDACYTVNVFPNPFVESSRVVMQATCHGELIATLYDMLGKRMWMRKYDVAGSDYQFSISGQNLTPGTYILQLELQGNINRQKIVKLESR